MHISRYGGHLKYSIELVSWVAVISRNNEKFMYSKSLKDGSSNVLDDSEHIHTIHFIGSEQIGIPITMFFGF